MSLSNSQYLVASEVNLAGSSLCLAEEAELDEIDKRASLEQLHEINDKISKATDKMKKYQKVAGKELPHKRLNIAKTVIQGVEPAEKSPIKEKMDRADKIMAQSKTQSNASPRSPIRGTVFKFPSSNELNEVDAKLNRADKVVANSTTKATKHEGKTMKSTVMSDMLSNPNPVTSAADEHWKKANKVAEKTGYVEVAEHHSLRGNVLKNVIKK